VLILKPDQDIVLAQSADPVSYFGMLRGTSRINRAFCIRQDILYIGHYGIMRGFHPWHASYNRVFMLNGLLDLGFTGWFLHLDADAWIHDVGFDLRGYLSGLSATSFVFAHGGTQQPWDVNDGIFLANCAHPDTLEVARAWQADVEAISPKRMRDAPEWSQLPQDQQLLHSVLRRDGDRLTAHLHYERHSFINGLNASFIRQVLRSHQRDPEKRLDTIILKVEAAMVRQDLPAEDAVVTFCGLARALGLPIPTEESVVRAIMADPKSLAAYLRGVLGENQQPGD
jgi:hypothetical protein